MTEPTPAEPTTDPTPAQVPPADPAPTKAEPDWKAEARKWEARAKENAAAAKKLADAEEAQKTAEQKLADRATAAEKTAAEAEARALRLEVASEKGLTAKQAKRLVGATREELETDADEILADFKPTTATPLKPGTPAPDPSQGAKTPTRERAKSLTEAIANQRKQASGG